MSDRRSNARKWLIAFAAVGIVATVALVPLPGGRWQPGILLFAVALFGFGGANLFYDALLKRVTVPQRASRISSLGFAFGYIGGGILFLWCVVAVRAPSIINAADEFTVMRNSFWWVGVWWAVFSIPLVAWCAVPTAGDNGAGMPRRGWRDIWPLVSNSFKNVLATLKSVRRHRTIALFLLAYWFYIDGVQTVIRMAIDFGTTLGFSASVLVTALLMVQFVSFPATILYYRLGRRIGISNAISIGIIGYIVITLLAIFILSRPIHFFILAFLVALFQGGIQALSRGMFATLIPTEHAGQYFGFYNMLGRFATILGPILLGTVVLTTDNYRVGITPILLLLVIGLILLRRVPRTT